MIRIFVRYRCPELSTSAFNEQSYEKVPTLVDVAKLANTSKATAARVFSRSKSANVKLETKARILEAADKLGYSPNLSAASLRSKTYLIAYVFMTSPILHPHR